MPVPEAVLRILRTLEAAGHEAWCVGGALRDALLGDPVQDVDLATSATPADVRRLFRRTVPVGIAHGTVGVLDEHGVLHEVTTFRADVRTDGRHAEVRFGVSLDDDLARRDFTINALAFHPVRGEWRDPFGGRDDLAAGLIRAVGDAAQRFREDRLRILRALRFAARFGFRIHPDTWRALAAQGADTGHLSAERVREEWWKGVATARDLAALARLWEESGVEATWLPRSEGGGEPADGAWPRDPILALACWRPPVAPHLQRLKASGAEIARGRAVDRGPARPDGSAPVAVRRWMARVGAAADDLAAVAAARGATADGWPAVMEGIRARGEPTARGALAVSGDDLVRAGLAAPGPALGRMLDRLLDLVLEDPARNTRDALLRAATE